MEFVAGLGVGAFLALGAGVMLGQRWTAKTLGMQADAVGAVSRAVAMAVAFPGGQGPNVMHPSPAQDMTAASGEDEMERIPDWMDEETELV